MRVVASITTHCTSVSLRLRVKELEGPNRLWALDWQYVGVLSFGIAAVGTSGALRLGFLTSEGQDLGFILGAVVGERYRGLQFSFDDRFRDGSPGDVMQGLQIRRLVDEEVLEYDLGTEAPYKIRWAENLEGTETFVALRPGLSIESVFSE